MKKFYNLLAAAVIFACGFQAIAATTGNPYPLNFFVTSGTILTPVLNSSSSFLGSFGYYNRDGFPINEDGSIRSSSPGAPTDPVLIKAQIDAQYSPTNANIVYP